MFKKILIANRGEIACRAIRSAREMGIATVAVYSDADRTALHTRMADEAVRIGPATSSESYLNSDNVLQACRDTDADAVYPGYGFLSENSQFAQVLAANNIAFIGPHQHAIECMGDKITSKKLAIEAGVSTVPGHTDIITDGDHAVRIATEIGYPVMLKASAGGGGKGMRVAYDNAECREGFERASNEARSSFGDDRVFIEKFIEQPRHIEIQILADKQGNTLYLNERECSIQRRHQKVIEEAPSAFLDPATRRAMGEQACALAQAVNYYSAGTVEFIVDAERKFYFLEMNTRLQVEHPVTEMITGLDLIEQMIKIAAGHPLDVAQSDIGINGWSMEARVYAENPFREFLPSTGRLTRYREPVAMHNVRIDSGVDEGGEVSIYYDPMISKLITWGESRNSAIDTLLGALDRYVIDGVTTNIPFLSALLSHEDFISGNISTNFIAQHYPAGFHPCTPNNTQKRDMDAVASMAHYLLLQRAATISGTLQAVVSSKQANFILIDEASNQTQVTIQQCNSSPSQYSIEIDGEQTTLHSDWQVADRVVNATIDGRKVVLQWQRSKTGGYQISNSRCERNVLILSPHMASLHQYMPEPKVIDTSKFLLSPMPGLLIDVLVKEGAAVNAGDPLAVIEAMKMENVMKAERSGTIDKIYETVGATLDVDQKILEFA